MGSFVQCRGQAVIETVIALLLLVTVAVGMQQQLVPAVKQNQTQLANNRAAIWSRTAGINTVSYSSDYASAKASGRALEPFSQWTDFDLEVTNLVQVGQRSQQPEGRYPMARITDGWAALSQDKLSQRPAKLVVNSLLSNDVMDFVLGAIGSLPIAEEIHPDSLIFGHIDADVVPPEALSESQQNFWRW